MNTVRGSFTLSKLQSNFTTPYLIFSVSAFNPTVTAWSNFVTNDLGIVESLTCVNTTVTNLDVNDSNYTDYATTVDNSIGMVEASESETFDTAVSSILNVVTPSILLIPNGRSSGKLFSFLPTNGSGDFSYTGSDANSGRTRINKAGNIEVVRRNLLPISTTQNAAWAPTTGFTRTNTTIKNNRASTLVVTSTQNGVDYQMGLRYSSISLSLVSGSIYTFSFRVKPNDGNGNFSYFIFAPNVSASNRQIGCSWNTYTGASISNYTEACTKLGRSITNEGNGIYLLSETFTMTETLTSITTLSLGFGNGLSTQVVSRSADFGTPQLESGSVPTSYQEADSGVSIPRMDYSSGSLGLLLEPQRTNLTQNNGTFSDYAFVGGTVTSSIFTEDTSNGNHRVSSAFYSGFASNTLYCFSVIVKKLSGGNRGVALRVSDGSTGEVGSQYLNLQTGALYGSNSNPGNWLASGLTTGVITLPNGRYLLYLVAQASSLSTTLTRVIFDDLFNSGFYVGTGATFEVFYPQSEAGTFPTSRIVTEGASKTRTVDNAFSPFFNSSAFTLYLHQTWNFIATEGFAHYLLSSAGLRAYFRATTTQIRLYDQVNGVAFGSVSASSTNQKVIIRFDGTKYNLFVNGVKSADYTPASPLNIRQIELASKGSNILGTSSEILTIHNHFIENSALTDAQCITLTT